MTSTAAPSAKVHRKSLGRRMAANWQPYVLLLIPVIITIIYKYGPMYGIQIAFRTIYIASGIWQEAGWGTIIYLATLSSVDASLYEAAKVDGASVFQRILHIDMVDVVKDGNSTEMVEIPWQRTLNTFH